MPRQRPSGAVLENKNKLDPLDKLFLRKVAVEEVFAEFLTNLSIDTGFSEEHLEGTLEPLCLCCWQLSRNIISDTEWTGDVNKLRAQVQELQQKLNLMNLTSMKAISNLQAARSGGGNYSESALAEVQYHEPLAYLDPVLRELCMGIVLDKFDQLCSGDCPPALMEKLLEAMEEKRRKEEESDKAGASKADGSRADSHEFVRKEFAEKEVQSDEAAPESAPKPDETELLRKQIEMLQKASQDTGVEKAHSLQESQLQKAEIERLKKALEETQRAATTQADEISSLKDEFDRCKAENLAEIRRLNELLSSKPAAQPAPQPNLHEKAEELLKERVREAETKRAAALKNRNVQTETCDSFFHVPEEKRLVIETRTMESQTELTSEYLKELFEASDTLQASCNNLQKHLGEAMAQGEKTTVNPKIVMHTEASVRALQRMQNVFQRLWEDVVLRERGERRRERAPAGPKAVKAVLKARDLPPKQVTPQASPNTEEHMPSTSAGEADDSDEDVENCMKVSPALEEGGAPHTKSTVSVSTQVNSETRLLPPLKDALPVLQGPKFVRQERRTVSLALMTPAAKAVVEAAQIQKHLMNMGRRPKQVELDEVESVSDFLRQRRRIRDGDPLASSEEVSAGNFRAAVADEGDLDASKRLPLNFSRLEKSVSLPMLT